MSETTFELIKDAIAKKYVHDLIEKTKENNDNHLIQKFYKKIISQ